MARRSQVSPALQVPGPGLPWHRTALSNLHQDPKVAGGSWLEGMSVSPTALGSAGQEGTWRHQLGTVSITEAIISMGGVQTDADGDRMRGVCPPLFCRWGQPQVALWEGDLA